MCETVGGYEYGRGVAGRGEDEEARNQGGGKVAGRREGCREGFCAMVEGEVVRRAGAGRGGAVGVQIRAASMLGNSWRGGGYAGVGNAF